MEELTNDIALTEDFEKTEDAASGRMHEVRDSAPLRAVLVSVHTKDEEREAVASLDELERLFDTAGGETLARLEQVREKPDGRTCIGSGKLEELRALCRNTGADTVIFDCELTPVQIRETETALDDGVSVIDRSMLILDIFASHAATAEGRLQVELAQLKYTAPRLAGKGTSMSRTGGGVGTRGPGETKLETDRRRLKARIHALEEELRRVEENRATMRRARDRSGIKKCAVVGYTNAGKSTLLNRLTDAGILAEDKLFATLDPTTRQFELPGGAKLLLTDTVGFIRKLPHHLIKAFKSTLDEAVYSDILIIAADASDADIASQMEVTYSTLSELGALGKPMLILFNKCDKASDEDTRRTLRSIAAESDSKCYFVSALTGEGIDTFVAGLEELVQSGKKRITAKIPLSESGAVNTAYRIFEEVETEYTETSIILRALADEKSAGKMAKYIENYEELFPRDEI